MKPIIISAPFGNYLSSEHATSTLGTYTLKNRAGTLRWWLFWRVLRTLRYRPSMGGWTNKLGLPNPGIEHLVELDRTKSSDWIATRIVSLHGFTSEEWTEIVRRVRQMQPRNDMTLLPFLAYELNVSCPNVGHLSVPSDLFEKAVEVLGADRVIVKLPPVSYWETFELAFESGVRTFHATNTLPTPVGGLAGPTLKRISLDVVKRIKDARPEITVIGGGGITAPADVVEYKKAGASHFAVASALLNPIRLLRRESWLKNLSLAASSGA